MSNTTPPTPDQMRAFRIWFVELHEDLFARYIRCKPPRWTYKATTLLYLIEQNASDYDAIKAGREVEVNADGFPPMWRAFISCTGARKK
jgi:hypothetical protein